MGREFLGPFEEGFGLKTLFILCENGRESIQAYEGAGELAHFIDHCSSTL